MRRALLVIVLLPTACSGSARATHSERVRWTPPAPKKEQIAGTKGLAPSPDCIASLGAHATKLSYDGKHLRITASSRDLFDAKIAKKPDNGLKRVVTTRFYTFADGEAAPRALAVSVCEFAFDLWNQVYEVVTYGPDGRKVQPPAINLRGVFRMCFDFVDLPVAETADLKLGVAHSVAVITEANPQQDTFLAAMRQRAMSAGFALHSDSPLSGTFDALLCPQHVAATSSLRFLSSPIVP